MEKYNLLCPFYLKKRLLKSGTPLNFKFLSESDVISALLLVFEDDNALALARDEKITYKEAKKRLKMLSLLKNGSNKYTSLQNEYIQRGYLRKSEEYKRNILTKFPLLVCGYDKDDSLLELLKDNNIEYKLVDLEYFKDYIDVFSRTKYTIKSYDESYVEVISAFNIISKLLKDGANIEDFLILAPTSYNDIISSFSSFYSLNVEEKVTELKNLSFLQEELTKYLDTLDSSNLLKQYTESKSPYEQDCLKALIKAISEVSELHLKNKKLIKEYILSKLAISSPELEDKTELKIVNSLSDAEARKYLFILGFSDALISSHKDNDEIADRYKDDLTYQSKAVIKNRRDIITLEQLFSLSTNIYLSYSMTDSFTEYHNCYFEDERYEIIHIRDEENEELLNNYSNNVDGVSDLLLLYTSFAHQNYQKLLIDNKIYSYLINQKEYKEKIESYDNKFKVKDENYFKEYFKDKEIIVSASNLDLYQGNPFQYYVEQILKVRDDNENINNILGTIIHTYIERKGQNFSLSEEIKKTISRAYGDTEGIGEYSLTSIEYFANKMIIYVDNVIFPFLSKLKDNYDLQPLEVPFDDEFVTDFTIKSLNDRYKDFKLKVKIDSIFATEDRSRALIVDFKTGDISTKFDYSKILLGRYTQLPIYALAYKKIQEKYPILENSKLIGTYLCQVYNKKDKENKCILNGFDMYEDALNHICKNSSEIDEEILTLDNNKIKKDVFQYVKKYLDFSKEEKDYDTSSFYELKEDNLLSKTILKSTYYAIIHFVKSLQYGYKLKSSTSHFPIYIATKSKNTTLAYDADKKYKDISFTRGEDNHQIYIVSLDDYDVSEFEFDDFQNLNLRKVKDGEDN